MSSFGERYSIKTYGYALHFYGQLLSGNENV